MTGGLAVTVRAMLNALMVAACVVVIAWAGAGRADDLKFSELEQGRYIATAGDCKFCHTADGGAPYAGGRPVETPFGVIYSTNITPDEETGIGRWSAEDFYRAMHEGIAADGSHLYPAFPYPWFTRMTWQDTMAVRAYLETLAPVDQENRENELDWPMSWRATMSGWNLLFFDDDGFQPRADKSREWNRGAYLVEGAAHCGACHTPKNLAGASDSDEPLQGSAIQDWYAPDLTSRRDGGVAHWSEDELVLYLRTGWNDKSSAAGPMADVVHNSTQFLSEADLHAIAVYVMDLAGSSGDVDGDEYTTVERDEIDLGKAIYVDNCTGCHLGKGEGQQDAFPSLADNPTVVAGEPNSVVQTILHGAERPATDSDPTGLAMPAFDWKLTDEQVAAVATYIRSAWGNHASAVSADDVEDLRATN